jgi:hypothetical protein
MLDGCASVLLIVPEGLENSIAEASVILFRSSRAKRTQLGGTRPEQRAELMFDLVEVRPYGRQEVGEPPIHTQDFVLKLSPTATGEDQVAEREIQEAPFEFGVVVQDQVQLFLCRGGDEQTSPSRLDFGELSSSDLDRPASLC